MSFQLVNIWSVSVRLFAYVRTNLEEKMKFPLACRFCPNGLSGNSCSTSRFQLIEISYVLNFKYLFVLWMRKAVLLYRLSVLSELGLISRHFNSPLK